MENETFEAMVFVVGLIAIILIITIEPNLVWIKDIWKMLQDVSTLIDKFV